MRERQVPFLAREVVAAYINGDAGALVAATVALEADAVGFFLMWLCSKGLATKTWRRRLAVAFGVDYKRRRRLAVAFGVDYKRRRGWVLDFYEKLGGRELAADSMRLYEFIRTDWDDRLSVASTAADLDSVREICVAVQTAAILRFLKWYDQRDFTDDEQVISSVLDFYESEGRLAEAEAAFYIPVDQRRKA